MSTPNLTQQLLCLLHTPSALKSPQKPLSLRSPGSLPSTAPPHLATTCQLCEPLRPPANVLERKVRARAKHCGQCERHDAGVVHRVARVMTQRETRNVNGRFFVEVFFRTFCRAHWEEPSPSGQIWEFTMSMCVLVYIYIYLYTYGYMNMPGSKRTNCDTCHFPNCSQTF